MSESIISAKVSELIQITISIQIRFLNMLGRGNNIRTNKLEGNYKMLS
ncbi:hypothetical protein [Gelidibacter sediminis]|nr:hypothetical protein [Gelidibacter sediminis]